MPGTEAAIGGSMNSYNANGPHHPNPQYPQQQYPQQNPGYGAPPQQPHQQSSVPQMGLSHDGGNFRIHYDGGAFSPSAIVTAAATGKGFEKPRMMGLVLLGLAVAFTVANYALVMVLNYYFPYLYSLAAIFGWTAMFLVITGQPKAQPNGAQAPQWARWGLMACFAIGVLQGIAMVMVPWESAL